MPRAGEDVPEVADVPLDVPGGAVGAVRRVEVGARGEAPVGRVAELVDVEPVEALHTQGRGWVGSWAGGRAGRRWAGGLCTGLERRDGAGDADVAGEDEERAKLLEGDAPDGGALQDAHGPAERAPAALGDEESHEAAASRDDGDDGDGDRPHPGACAV